MTQHDIRRAILKRKQQNGRGVINPGELAGKLGVSELEVHAALRFLEAQNMIGPFEKGSPSRIFIGHGHSLVWKDLKDFVAEKLGLEWEEFDREPVAGYTVQERLESMLDHAIFAFLVMTAEDEHADGTTHARENVIHEIGLFQGRLGFKKAIVLVEEGCQQFTNLSGLIQLRFPRNNIKWLWEDIREVLQREEIL